MYWVTTTCASNVTTNAWPATATIWFNDPLPQPPQRSRFQSRQQRRLDDELERFRDLFARHEREAEETARHAAIAQEARRLQREWLEDTLRATAANEQPHAPVERLRVVAIRRQVLRATAKGVRNYRARAA